MRVRDSPGIAASFEDAEDQFGLPIFQSHLAPQLSSLDFLQALAERG